jgi:hypothetical protein
MDGGHTVEQDAHLRSCPACSNIVSDLVSIREGARLLRASDEPSPRVWNAIEFTLRQEGIMRDPQPNLALVSPSSRTWRIKPQHDAKFVGKTSTEGGKEFTHSGNALLHRKTICKALLLQKCHSAFKNEAY